MTVSRIAKLVRETTRTVSLEEAAGHRDLGIEIVVADDAPRWDLMVRAAVALSLRCLSGPVAVRLTSGEVSKRFSDIAVAEATRFDAAHRVVGSAIGAPRLGIAVSGPTDVAAYAEGWSIGINNPLRRTGHIAAPAGMLSVCCAFGKLFAARVLKRPGVLEESWSLSLSDLGGGGDIGRSLDLGRVLLIGAGAIGSSFAFVLKHSGWVATVTVVDDDVYAEPNEETTLLIGPQHARGLRAKAPTLASLAAVPGTTFNPLRERVSASHEPNWRQYDTVVCAVDNAETRRFLDRARKSAHVINAGVGGTAAEAGHVLFTRHRPQDHSLSYWYPGEDGTVVRGAPAPSEFVDECSRIAYENVSLAAPFIGGAAGALLVAHLGLRAAGHSGLPGYVKFDLLKMQGAYVAR